MKISNTTLAILKNFAGINQSIYITAGDKKVKTIAVNKSIVGYAQIEEEFNEDFGLYDINEFLTAISLFNDPEFEFTADKVIVSDSEGNRMVYGLVEKELVLTPPDTIKFPDSDFSITVTKDNLEKIKKSSSAISVPDMTYTAADGKITLALNDTKNSSSNKFSMPLCDCGKEDKFQLIASVDTLKMLPYDYTVELSKKGISRWFNDDKGIEYYIPLDLNSSYD